MSIVFSTTPLLWSCSVFTGTSVLSGVVSYSLFLELGLVMIVARGMVATVPSGGDAHFHVILAFGSWCCCLCQWECWGCCMVAFFYSFLFVLSNFFHFFIGGLSSVWAYLFG